MADIEPDEPTADSDRAPLTGNIQSSSQRPLNQNYLTSQIPGEDRRAAQNTIDESVWDTVSRDLFAVWEKMKQVLWPKYLLGGILQRSGTGTADTENQGFGRDIRGLVGRWPDTDGILQGAMSDGLRDWDLWYGTAQGRAGNNANSLQGPSGLLPSSESFPVDARRQGPERSCLLRCLHSDLDWRIGGCRPDQIAGRKHVSQISSRLYRHANVGSSLMQSVSILGYTIFPLVIASLLSAVGLFTIARIPIYIVLVAWSLAAGVSILGGSGVVKNRVALAIYPMFLFYVAIGCLCFIS